CINIECTLNASRGEIIAVSVLNCSCGTARRLGDRDRHVREIYINLDGAKRFVRDPLIVDLDYGYQNDATLRQFQLVLARHPTRATS
ncbi:hypothetical protein BTE77_35875, partial [Ensifer adhaerens]